MNKRKYVGLKLIVLLITGFIAVGCTQSPDVMRREPREIVDDYVERRIEFHYAQFGATGDGVTDDFDAIVRTHRAANRIGRNAIVIAGKGTSGEGVFYIGPTRRTAIIQTDTDWTGARFILDDERIVRYGPPWEDSWLFRVESAQRPFRVYSITNLTRDQPRIFANLGREMLYLVTDNTTRRYIRQGHNEDPGTISRDIFLVDRYGFVDPNTPILWDFNNISTLTAFPIDDWTLTITGGHFTTIVSRGNVTEPYKNRGIEISRSNTVIDGIYHDVVGEDWPTTTYRGFLHITTAANVTVKNFAISGRFFNGTRGTYDIAVSDAVNISFINGTQLNDIHSNRYWGAFISDFTKNITFDNVTISRFDAHMGVFNATILNSTLGYQGIRLVGRGTLRVENTTVTGMDSFIMLRADYGATWEGNVFIRNSRLYPVNVNNSRVMEIYNNGTWNFGYQCFMPEFIFIDNFQIMERPGIPWGGNVTFIMSQMGDGPETPPPFPVIPTNTVFFRNLSGGTPRISNSSYYANIINASDEWPFDVWPWD